MRIISGKFKGKKLLDSTKYKDLRPTTDKNRESLFNIISSQKFINSSAFQIENSTIIDLCCGTGAIGIEFLSRGTKNAIFIDNSKQHLDLAKKNVTLIKQEQNCEFILCDVENHTLKLNKKADLIYLDPPYEKNYSTILKNILASEIISNKTILIAECPSNIDISIFSDFKIFDLKKYSSTSFIFLKL